MQMPLVASGLPQNGFSSPTCRLVLFSELDAAGHTDALEIPLLLSSDVAVADVERDQRPI